MNAIRGTFIDGTVVFETPPDLPNGTRVIVLMAGSEYVGIGMREEDWPTTPEGIEALIAKIDQVKPFLTPEEEEAWRKALAEQKAWELAQWDEHRRKLESLFDDPTPYVVVARTDEPPPAS